MRRFFFTIGVVVITGLSFAAFSLGGASGCGGATGGGSSGGGSGDAGIGTGDAPQDLFTTFNTVAEVVSTALNVNTPPALRLEEGFKSLTIHVHCSNGVQSTVTGAISGDGASGSFDLSAGLGGCDGVNGTVGFSGTYATSGSNRNFTVDFTGGAAGNGCSLTLDSLGYGFSVQTDLIAAPDSESVTATLTATCTETGGAASVSCDFGSGVDALNLTALKAACTCSGSGCP